MYVYYRTEYYNLLEPFFMVFQISDKLTIKLQIKSLCNFEGWERKRCFFTYRPIQLDLFHSHPSIWLIYHILLLLRYYVSWTVSGKNPLHHALRHWSIYRGMTGLNKSKFFFTYIHIGFFFALTPIYISVIYPVDFLSRQ